MRPGRIQKRSRGGGGRRGHSAVRGVFGLGRVAGLQQNRVRRRSSNGRRSSTAAAAAGEAAPQASLAKRSCDTQGPKRRLV
jgi:hypothetical protein